MASQNISLLTLTIAATAVVVAHRFVDLSGAHATATETAVGASRSDAADGETFAADVVGTAVVEAEAAIAVGDAIEVGTDGKAAAQSAGTTVARAVQEAANAGDLVEVLLIQN